MSYSIATMCGECPSSWVLFGAHAADPAALLTGSGAGSGSSGAAAALQAGEVSSSLEDPSVAFAAAFNVTLEALPLAVAAGETLGHWTVLDARARKECRYSSRLSIGLYAHEARTTHLEPQGRRVPRCWPVISTQFIFFARCCCCCCRRRRRCCCWFSHSYPGGVSPELQLAAGPSTHRLLRWAFAGGVGGNANGLRITEVET